MHIASIGSFPQAAQARQRTDLPQQAFASQSQPVRFSGDVGNAIGGFITLVLGLFLTAIPGGLKLYNNTTGPAKSNSAIEVQLDKFQETAGTPAQTAQFKLLLNQTLTEFKNSASLQQLEISWTDEQKNIAAELISKATEDAKNPSDLENVFNVWLEKAVLPQAGDKVDADAVRLAAHDFFNQQEGQESYANLLFIAMLVTGGIAGLGIIRIPVPGNEFSNLWRRRH